MLRYLKDNDTILYILAVVLLIPALFANLGVLPFFVADDEATRVLVPLEMIYSGDYTTATVNGMYYYFKPALFYWVIAFFFNLTGSSSAFVARVPAVMFLLLMGLSIYYFAHKHYSRRQAAIMALAFVTSGRILFWESFFCMMDIPFSLLIFTMFMSIYHFHRKEQWYALFLVAYGLAAMAFLIKGLPALLFLGFTLLAYFIFTRTFQKLISLAHASGMLLFLTILTGYYLNYWLQNPDISVFTALWSESTGRYTDYGFADAFFSTLRFPFDMWVHFLPWTLFILYVFCRGFWREVRSDRFLGFCLLVFVVNIIPYWTAPGIYPRYILMLVPLIYIVFFHFYFRHHREYPVATRLLENVILSALALLALAVMALPFWDKTAGYEHVWLKTLSVFFFMIALIYLYGKLKSSRLILFILGLIAARLIFAWFIWPQRLPEVQPYKEDAVRVAEITRGKELNILGWITLHHGFSFYVAQERKEILPLVRDLSRTQLNTYYVVDAKSLENLREKGYREQVYHTFRAMDERHPVYLVKFLQYGENKHR